MRITVTFNVRPEEFAKLRQLDARCHGAEAYDERGFLEGMAELFGAAITMDLVLLSQDGVRIQVVTPDEKTVRIECTDRSFLVSDLIGPGPTGPGALEKYLAGGTLTFN